MADYLAGKYATTTSVSVSIFEHARRKPEQVFDNSFYDSKGPNPSDSLEGPSISTSYHQQAARAIHADTAFAVDAITHPLLRGFNVDTPFGTAVFLEYTTEAL